MIERARHFLPRKLNSPACPWNQIRFHSLTWSLRTGPISPRAKLGLSLASILGLVTMGFSWSKLNLDTAQDSPATRDDSREHRRNVCDDLHHVYIRRPHAYMQTSEQTVFPGDHTGVARYDTAQLDSTLNRVTDFAAGVLPVPSGYCADDSGPVTHGTVSWMRRNIVPAMAGSLADAHSAQHPPPDARIDDALRQGLARLDSDVRTDAPWARQATPTPASTLLAFFDSESRVLRVACTGAGRAFFGRRAGGGGGGGHECIQLTGSGGGAKKRHLLPDPGAQSRVRDVEELVVFPSRGSFDPASVEVEVENVEVRDGDFLVLGSHNTWTGLSGDEAVQTVSGWMREQEESRSTTERPVPGRRWPPDPLFDFDLPWKDNRGLELGWFRTMMIPDLIQDVDEVFSGSRGNVAGRVLRPTEHEHCAKGNAYDQVDHASIGLGAPGSESKRNGGSVMVVIFTDGRSERSKGQTS
ncbi:hypothetical protein BJV74DRAFT_864652 [Russula compacta]|nr:hypothetical protein BJV74DRAFT_864652 [Russula compacta]